MISKVVQSHPDIYTEAFLGVETSEYSKWITESTSWGGGIEIAILSEHYEIEICIVDTVNIRIDRFGTCLTVYYCRNIINLSSSCIMKKVFKYQNSPFPFSIEDF